MSLTKYRRLFPITEEYAYLNHAAVAPYSVPVAKAMEDFRQSPPTRRTGHPKVGGTH